MTYEDEDKETSEAIYIALEALRSNIFDHARSFDAGLSAKLAFGETENSCRR